MSCEEVFAAFGEVPSGGPPPAHTGRRLGRARILARHMGRVHEACDEFRQVRGPSHTCAHLPLNLAATLTPITSSGSDAE